MGRAPPLPLLLALLAGCTCRSTPEELPPPVGEDSEAPTDDTGAPPDDSEPPPDDTAPPEDTGPDWGGPCSDGSWSGWTSPEGLVHVAVDATSGDGSVEAPFRTVQQALEAHKGVPGELNIAVWPGVYDAYFMVKRPEAPRDRVTISGCGPGETVLGGGRPRHPSVAIEGPSTATLRGVTVSGDSQGTGLVIRNGADATVEDVEVSWSKLRGVSISGPTTRATLRDVLVHQLEDGAAGLPMGWGVTSSGAAVTLERVNIHGARLFGLFAQYGTVSASELVVRDTAEGWGQGGYGVYLHNMSYAELSDCHVENSHGAGILLLDIHAAEVQRCSVYGVHATTSGRGDGIVARRAFRPEQHGAHEVWLRDNVVSDVDRMGIAVWGPEAHLGGNQLRGCGYDVEGVCAFVKPDSAVSGPDAWQPLDRELTPIGPVNNHHGGRQPRGKRYQGE
jgi:hypothetical protein